MITRVGRWPLSLMCSLVLLAGCGDSSSRHADRFSGEAQQVAASIEQLQKAFVNADVKLLCSERLFSTRLVEAMTLAEEDTCERSAEFNAQHAQDFKLEILQLRVAGAVAYVSAKATDRGHARRDRFILRKVKGRWLIDAAELGGHRGLPAYQIGSFYQLPE